MILLNYTEVKVLFTNFGIERAKLSHDVVHFDCKGKKKRKHKRVTRVTHKIMIFRIIYKYIKY